MFSDQDGHKHRINLDLTGFKPEDVKVTLKDRVVSLGIQVLVLVRTLIFYGGGWGWGLEQII